MPVRVLVLPVLESMVVMVIMLVPAVVSVLTLLGLSLVADLKPCRKLSAMQLCGPGGLALQSLASSARAC